MTPFSVAYHRRPELRGAVARGGVTLLLGTAFGLSTLVTPLYLIFQQQYGFDQITLTLIYAVYAVGNIAALLFLGHVSDHIGRRLTILAAIAVLFAASLVFLFARGVAALYVARVLSGLGIGIASGTGNAWLADLVERNDERRAATLGTTSNFVGLGLAPLFAGVLAEYAPWPLHLPFILYLVVLGAVTGVIWFTQETVPVHGRDRFAFEMRPRLSLPREIRGRFVAPAITGFGLMALVGFYAALMPTMLSHDLHIDSHAAAGALFFELATMVALVIVSTQRVSSRAAMMSSLALMIPATAAVVAAQVFGSLPVMLAATAVVAVSAGLGYRGSLQVVNQIAPAEQRAAVVSTYFVCCFTGNALPVIGVGVLSTIIDRTIADGAFAGTITAFAVVALIFGLRHRG